jgi:ParB-like chromosome segregation protein Spo0J
MEKKNSAGRSRAKTPFEDLLPPLSREEYEALRASIRANDVLNPVIFDEDDNVLDGHNRLEIDPDAPRRVISGLSLAEKRAFVFSANMGRRNLSPAQKKAALSPIMASSSVTIASSGIG